MASPPSLSFSDEVSSATSTTLSFSFSDKYELPSATSPPPSFSFSDDDDDKELSSATSPPPSFSFSDDDEVPAAAHGAEDRKVKLAGRRRLCKFVSSSPPAADDDDSICDILDDLTARHNPRPAPRPCAFSADGPEDPDSYYDATNSSSSPPPPHPRADGDGVVDLSSSDDDEVATAAVVRREAKVENRKKAAKAVVNRRVKVENRKKVAKKVVSKKVKVEKPQVPAPPFASAFAAKGAIQEEKEDVGWEKTEDFKMEPTGCGVMVNPYKLRGSIFKMLYPHQLEGLKWLWDLHCRGTGGILADDMGLGKTMQISAFLAGLFHSRLIRRVLVVAPKAIHTHWSKELSAVGLKNKIKSYSSTTSVKVRNSELQSAFKDGGVLLTTYDIVRNNYKRIRGDLYDGNIEAKIRGDFYNDADEDEDGNLWDYVILDEGHIIKNPSTQRAKSLLEIPCVHRIVLSGTPIQNNLKEIWALFYFCCPEVLGTKDDFKTDYESAMTRGTEKSASDEEKHIGSHVAQEYQERIEPYFLRREKSEVFADDKFFPKKSELIIWLKLTAWQRKLYEAFLNTEIVHNSIQGSPLAAITIMKKICDHPMILTKGAAKEILEGMDDEELDDKELDMAKEMAMNLADTAYKMQIEEEISCKLTFIKSLLRKLLEEGHHVLIFSQTRKMLNLIQEAILLEGYKFLRIDGNTKDKERERIVKNFQEGSEAQIFLLTTRVGGLGLTLTKAARVIVVDPAWNPSTDNQAVDRAYRIGQTKDVIVYRLMTCGTIEEKIYKLQVFKGALFRTATEQKEQIRYFSKRQEMFSLPVQGFDVSLTQKQLQEEHGQQLFMDDPLMREHIEFLEQQGIAGVSNHSLLFTKTAVLPTLSEHDALDSKPPSMCVMARQYSEASSSDYVANGAAHAFKPNFTPRAYSAANSTKSESPEEIKAKINGLSQTVKQLQLH